MLISNIYICFLCNFKIQVNELSDVAYCSEWYNLNVRENKMFLTLLMQLQMKVHKIAYGYVKLSLESFGIVKIINF